MASFFVIRGRDQGRRYELASGQTLGRESGNGIQLRDTEISRRHAQIVEREDGFWLLDLDSSNGCFVNDTRVSEYRLRSGDRVLLGVTLMIYTGGEVADPSSLSGVGIVGEVESKNESRIIKSISQAEGSQVFGGDAVESPWLARARSNLQVMYRTALAVSHTLDIDELLRRILELIFEWVEADRGCVMLFDSESHELTPSARMDRNRNDPAEQILISRTILDYVTKQNEGVLTSDAQEDERWDPGASIVTMGVREAICVPMQGRYDVVGVIYIDTYTPPSDTASSEGNKFSAEHLKLMVAIAHQAALAVEDTSYYSAMLQAERLAAVGQTIATLSHHIKNILQGIRGGSFLIEEGLKNGESGIVRKGWGIVDRNQDKISNLVMDMLSFSKDRDPIMEPANLNELVGDVIELMQVRSNENQVELNWQPDSSLPTLLFDADAMHRAVLNTVSNAVDACEKVEGARVDVSTSYSVDANEASIVVFDNGQGIAEHDLQKIFSVFESRKGSRGTGLGLPVSQKIMQEHHGHINVKSEIGVGSTFTMMFPAELPPPTTDETRELDS